MGGLGHTPLQLGAPLPDKNFYLLSLIERTPDARKALLEDRTLAGITAERNAALEQATRTCGIETDCYASAFRWTEAQTEAASQALAGVYDG